MLKAWHAARLGVLLTLLAVCAADAASPQSYPTRPIRLIAPFAAGGGLDLVARLVGQKMSESMGQPVVIDNRTGAGGTIGAELVARALPDGYTLILGNNSTHGASQAITSKLPYDTTRDFTPISLVGASPHLVLTPATVPAKSVKEFIDLAKAKPGQLNFGSSGTGSQTHLSGELLKFVKEIGLRVD